MINAFDKTLNPVATPPQGHNCCPVKGLVLPNLCVDTIDLGISRERHSLNTSKVVNNLLDRNVCNKNLLFKSLDRRSI